MIWLIGSGHMSVEYSKVLEAQKRPYVVVGRGQKSAEDFKGKTGKEVIQGGLESFLGSNPVLAHAVIVCVGVAQLYETTLALIAFGVNNILVEKPAGLSSDEIEHLQLAAKDNKSDVFVAYNRRFYSSVLTAKRVIEDDGGVTSFNFELTEWGHVIGKLEKAKCVKEKWFLANTTHVIDLAFYLGGRPEQLSAFTAGGNEWHPNATIFSGSGVSDKNALFSYQGNWQAPGRWSVELLTQKHRLIFKPIEKLRIQKIGSVLEEEYEVDDELDTSYKPGLYLQVEDFLNNRHQRLCSIKEQAKNSLIYDVMAGYS